MINLFELKHKHILITGASSGIGRQCAISCSKMGAKVSIVARNVDKLNETLSLMDSKNNHQLFSFNVVDFDAIGDIVKTAADQNGKINGFIHCAGMELTLPIISMKPEYYADMYSVNVIAAFEFAKHLSKKRYCSPNGSSFVFIASVMGMLGEIAHVSYCATKGALIAGAKALALEFANKNIRVNTISPAQIENTEMTNKMLENFNEQNQIEKLAMHPLGYGQPADVANACVYLLSDAAKWITGTNLVVDGGYSSK